jgi:fructose-1,6-bisphosphatase/inositol monophosphatase family enzyme
MNHELLKEIFIHISTMVCDKVYQSLRQQSVEVLSAIHKEGHDDTIYAIDKDVEDIIVPELEKYAAQLGGIVLIAEGIGDESGEMIPHGMKKEDAKVKIIMDPIDGTRGIIYNKRSAFFLVGVAPNKPSNSLKDIEFALMCELPTSKALYSDTFYASKGKGVKGYSRNLVSNEKIEIYAQPSRSSTILGGFAQISRFFPPGRDILAKIEDELVMTLFPMQWQGRAAIFEDQYISSGGQLYEMLCGHDRFIAEIRNQLYSSLAKQGIAAGHTCHPYDLCCHMIGTEADMIITDAEGLPLDAPLDTTSAVDWVGYANKEIFNQVHESFQKIKNKYLFK